MIRTQIYLPEAMVRKLRAIRSQQKRAVGEIIREAVEKFLNDQKDENDILELTKLELSGGPKDLSDNLDAYLYGEK